MLLWTIQSNGITKVHNAPGPFQPETTAWAPSLFLLTFLATNCIRLGRSGECWLTSSYIASTVDAPNACSFNPITGELWCSNYLLFSYDPLAYDGIITSNVAKVFTASISSKVYYGASDYVENPRTSSITGTIALNLISSFNPARTALNAATAVNNLYFLVGLIAK